MTEPEQALERARAAAESLRAQGISEEAPSPHEEPDTAKLLEWALLDPDLEDVRSTRRFGAPITAVKRLMLRLLYQYHAELIAQQTRFNVHLVRRLEQLEERIEALERAPRARHREEP